MGGTSVVRVLGHGRLMHVQAKFDFGDAFPVQQGDLGVVFAQKHPGASTLSRTGSIFIFVAMWNL